MQPYKLLALKVSVLLPTPFQWQVLQIVMVTQGISFVSVYNPHPNPSASLLQSRETALLPTATIKSHKIWLGQGCGIGCGEGPILTTLNLRIRIRRDLRDHLIQAFHFVKERNEAKSQWDPNSSKWNEAWACLATQVRLLALNLPP